MSGIIGDTAFWVVSGGYDKSKARKSGAAKSLAEDRVIIKAAREAVKNAGCLWQRNFKFSDNFNSDNMLRQLSETLDSIPNGRLFTARKEESYSINL